MKKHEKIAVIGAGSWGTALALLLASKGHYVALWGHKEEHIYSLITNKENSKYLPGQYFPDNLKPEVDLESSVKNATTIVMVVPSHSCRTIFKTILPYIQPGANIISAIKGIEDGTFLTMTEIIRSLLQENSLLSSVQIGVLSGPSFALEVAKKMPTAVTIGFNNIDIAKKQQAIFGTHFFRVYTSQDVLGLELSGALKNVIAIATGMSDGLQYGLNARAALITRGLTEIKRLGIVMGAEAATFSGLSGIGDLLLTCTGNLSRNRQVGLELGRGKSLNVIQKNMKMIAEGIKTTKSGYLLSKKQHVEMPILEQVYKIIYEQVPCSEAVYKLLSRDLRKE